MIRVALIGTGNLAVHILKALESHDGVTCVQWIGRKHSPSLQSSTPYFSQFQKDIETNVCLIAVSDDYIKIVAQQFSDTKILVAHTAGAVDLSCLEPIKRRGVFYPLQSFLKNIPVNWEEIPICVTAENEADLKILESLAKCLSNEIYVLTENQRLHMHTAAVFANNFCNHLLGISQSICKKANVPFSVLKPLVEETFNRTFKHSALKLQTGPAKRNNLKTQEKHLTLLSDKEVNLYQSLSHSILNTHKNEL